MSKRSKEKVKYLMNELIQAIEAGDLQTLNQLLERFLMNEEPSAQYEAAEMLMHYGYLQQAKQVLENLQFIFPEEAQIKIDLASVAMELDLEDEALEHLLSVHEEDAEYPQALVLLADYYQMQGLYEVAERHINKALELLPTEPLLLFAKAELLFETGRFTESVRLYEELHSQQAEIAGVQIAERLAEVYRAGGAYEQALTYYMETLEDKVTPDLLFGSAYSAFQIEKYEVAVTQLEDLKELDPDYYSAYLLLAQSYAMLEDNKRALLAIEEGIARDEYDKSLYLFAGKMALKTQDEEKAMNYLQQAIALDPEYMEATIVLMSVYAQREMYEEIIDLYESLQREDIEFTAILPFVANAYNEAEKFEKANEIYTLAYTEYKEESEFLEKYCYFLIEEGQQEKAKQIAEQLVLLEPTSEQWQALLERFE